jgi:hypothetical protein
LLTDCVKGRLEVPEPHAAREAAMRSAAYLITSAASSCREPVLVSNGVHTGSRRADHRYAMTLRTPSHIGGRHDPGPGSLIFAKKPLNNFFWRIGFNLVPFYWCCYRREIVYRARDVVPPDFVVRVIFAINLVFGNVSHYRVWYPITVDQGKKLANNGLVNIARSMS